MGLDLRLLLPLALMVAGMILYHYDFFVEDSPLLRVSCMFSSFFCFTIGIGWLYTAASKNPTLKILDWALICLTLCMMPIFDLLGLPLFLAVPFLPVLVAARFFVTWYLKKDDLRFFDLGLFFTILGFGMALAIFGMLGTISTSTGLTEWTVIPLVAVGICLTLARLIITWWKWKATEGEV